MAEPAFSAIHHLTLNVRDLERSERWYADVLGLVRLRAFEQPAFSRVIMQHPAGAFTVGLNRFHDPAGDVDFDERHTAGLDHFALQVPDRETLDAWLARLEQHGVTHSEIKPGAAPGAFLIAFRDPDNIQIEVYVPPRTAG